MGLNELYNSIVDEVVNNVKEAFLEEGYDEQTLRALKEAWLRRICESQQPRTQIVLPSQNTQREPQQQPQPQLQPQLQAQPQHQPQIIQQQSSAQVIQPPQSQIIQQAHIQMQNHHSQAQQQQQQQQQARQHNIPQLDGSNGTSDEDEDIDESDGDFADDGDDVSDEEDKETDANRDDEDPLNSGDDVSNDESSEMFETDNVVVCQYDKITRNRNKWKFHLKDGIMNIDGRDYVFQKAVGDAEW